MDNFNVLFGITATALGILFSYLAYQKGLKTDGYKTGATEATVRSDIEFIKDSIKQILGSQKEMSDKYDKVFERTIVNEERSKSAHKRLDEIEKKIN